MFLLGAGFSKGFHPPMPLMADLADRVVSALGIDPDELKAFNGDFEAWLSYLSTRQPWDSESTALRNLATFQEASDVIASEIERASSLEVSGSDRRARLLQRLVLDWCVHSSEVLTFNYDLLVELELQRWERRVSGADLYPLPLVERLPLGVHPFLSATMPTTPLPLLYKLHGSINWLYPGIDHGDGPITLGPWRGLNPNHPERRVRHLHADLAPLVVPPTSTKSPFYSNTALRSLWANTAQVLRRADELIVIGYSFPVSDQQVTTLIRTTLPIGARIHVVTADERVPARVKKSFPQHVVTTLIDEDAAATYVDGASGPVIEWSHASDGNGVREWLSGPDGEVTRMASYFERESRGAELEQLAMEELAKVWPSISLTWQNNHASENDDRIRYRAYVPLSEWRDRQHPWASRGRVSAAGL